MVSFSDHWTSDRSDDWNKEHVKSVFIRKSKIYYYVAVRGLRKGEWVGLRMRLRNIYNGEVDYLTVADYDWQADKDYGDVIICFWIDFNVSHSPIGEFRIYPKLNKSLVSSHTYRYVDMKRCYTSDKIGVFFYVTADRSGSVDGCCEIMYGDTVEKKIDFKMNALEGSYWYLLDNVPLSGLATGRGYYVRIRLFGKEESSLRVTNALAVIS